MTIPRGTGSPPTLIYNLQPESSKSGTKRKQRVDLNHTDNPLSKLKTNHIFKRTFQPIHPSISSQSHKKLFDKAEALITYRTALRSMGATDSPLRNPDTNNPLKGSYGRVMKCKDETVVVKQQSPDRREGKEDRIYESGCAEREKGFQKELTGSPHIVELLNSHQATTAGVAKYAMFMPNAGISLSDKYRKTDASLSDLERIGNQILEALEVMGKHEILHADLKPPNIMEDDNGLVRITDFGLSQRLDRARSAEILYTRPYRPPEIVTTAFPITPESDIWALGCILFELLTEEILIPVAENEICPWQADVDMIYAFCDRFNFEQVPDCWKPINIHNAKFEPSFSYKLPTIKECLKMCPKLKNKGERAKDFTEILMKMLHPVAKERISAREARQHPFFKNGMDMGVKINILGNVKFEQNLWIRITPPEGTPIKFDLARAHTCYHMKKSNKPFDIEFYHPLLDGASSSSRGEKILSHTQLTLKDNPTIYIDPIKNQACTSRLSNPKFSKSLFMSFLGQNYTPQKQSNIQSFDRKEVNSKMERSFTNKI